MDKCVFFAEIQSSEEWQAQLAKKNWKKGKSAYELAQAWLGTGAGKIPTSVNKLLQSSDVFRNMVLEKAIVEKKVKLDEYGRASQTDLMLYGHGKTGKIVIAVEGKEAEPFDMPVAEWLKSSREGSNKRPRLDKLLRSLKLDRIGDKDLDNVRYQLLHRSVSAIIEAKAYGAKYAMMLVHSFMDKDAEDHFDDYAYFLGLLGIKTDAIKRNAISGPVILNGVELYFGWVRDRKSDNLL